LHFPCPISFRFARESTKSFRIYEERCWKFFTKSKGAGLTDYPERNKNSEVNNDKGSKVPTSPIRPEDESGREGRVLPSVPRPVVPNTKKSSAPLTSAQPTYNPGDVRAEKAAEAIEVLRQKMAAISEEYASGKINRAQFDAIYLRYQERRQITERMIERDPDTGAWRSVVEPGYTGFLRQYYEAKVESYAIYHIARRAQIVRTGHVQIPEEQMTPILNRLYEVWESQETHEMIPAYRVLQDKRWVFFIPGEYSLAVVIFSLEPATAQIEMVKDIHTDFERANVQMLRTANYDLKQMVFPHRALFEL
jgi:hypothetical protein